MGPSLWRLIRYAVVGGSGAVLQIATLWLWVSVMDMRAYYLAGVWIGFVLALALTFPLQKYWTFKDHMIHRAPRQFLWYTAIALGTLALNTLLLSLAKALFEHLHVDFFRLWYLAAEGGIVVGIAGISFLLNRMFTFAVDSAAEKTQE